MYTFMLYQQSKLFRIQDYTTELDEENADSPPYLISHGEKIVVYRFCFITHSETVDRVCAAMEVQPVHLTLHVSVCGKDLNIPNFCSLFDDKNIICGDIGSLSSPYSVDYNHLGVKSLGLDCIPVSTSQFTLLTLNQYQE